MSGDKSAILFAIFAITPHIIAVDGNNQPEILADTFYFKNQFLFITDSGLFYKDSENFEYHT